MSDTTVALLLQFAALGMYLGWLGLAYFVGRWVTGYRKSRAMGWASGLVVAALLAPSVNASVQRISVERCSYVADMVDCLRREA